MVKSEQIEETNMKVKQFKQCREFDGSFFSPKKDSRKELAREQILTKLQKKYGR
jgi:hypothetical protein